MKTVSAIPEEETPPSVPPPHDDKHASKFANLKFRTKLEARGILKRSVRQLCSFDESLADRGSEVQKKKQRKRQNIESLDGESSTKKRRKCDFDEKCSVCHIHTKS